MSGVPPPPAHATPASRMRGPIHAAPAPLSARVVFSILVRVAHQVAELQILLPVVAQLASDVREGWEI
ncbi:hypothetical protein G6F50_018709 [Rhizopus delemar]|uniref:Uncharacterized protein n=1 Tax=Rhizopus delemar TaxID=936053 RepID=A0A9P6XLD7_9FUNG|nr:hypothetical protein G6F50_018709 [Rhizopus delemar]